MQTGAQIGLVCFFGTEGRLGIVLQEKIHPRGKLKLFSLPDDLEKLVVSGLKPLAEFALSVLPVFGKGRLPDALTFPISVGNPKNLSVVAFEYSTIMFTRSCHSPPRD